MWRLLLLVLALGLMADECSSDEKLYVSKSQVHRDCGRDGPAVSSRKVVFVLKEEQPVNDKLANTLSDQFGKTEYHPGALVTCRSGAIVLVTTWKR